MLVTQNFASQVPSFSYCNLDTLKEINKNKRGTEGLIQNNKNAFYDSKITFCFLFFAETFPGKKWLPQKNSSCTSGI